MSSDYEVEESGFQKSSCIKTYSRNIPQCNTNKHDEGVALFDHIFGSKHHCNSFTMKFNDEKLEDQENQKDENIKNLIFSDFSYEKNKLKKNLKKNPRKRRHGDLKNDLYLSFQKTGIDETLKKFKEIPLNIIYENSKGDYIKHENTYYDCDKNEYYKEVVFLEETPSKKRKINQDIKKAILNEKNNFCTPKNKTRSSRKENLMNENTNQEKNKKRFTFNISEIANNFSFFEKNSILNSTALLSKSFRKLNLTNINKDFSIRSIESENDANCSQTNCLSKFCNSFSQNHILHKIQEINDLNFQKKILKISEPNYITTFTKVLKNVLNDCKKIGEGSYGEVFISKDENDTDIILKIIKLPNQALEHACSSFLPEILIGFCLSELLTSKKHFCNNFINFKKCSYIKGKYPKKLIEEWEKYQETKGSENEHPDEFKLNSQFLLLTLENGGVDLESFSINSPKQIDSIFKQCLMALSVAEKAFKFEHRDLHLGNILISETDDEKLKYTINNKNYYVETNNLKISIIDYTLSRLSRNDIVIFDDLSKYNDIFEGEGDYQFEIYRKMRNLNNNDWRSFNPKTNILWLHFLLTKLLNNFDFDNLNNSDKKLIENLENYENKILDYKSAFDAIQLINT